MKDYCFLWEEAFRRFKTRDATNPRVGAFVAKRYVELGVTQADQFEEATVVSKMNEPFECRTCKKKGIPGNRTGPHLRYGHDVVDANGRKFEKEHDEAAVTKQAALKLADRVVKKAKAASLTPVGDYDAAQRFFTQKITELDDQIADLAAEQTKAREALAALSGWKPEAAKK